MEIMSSCLNKLLNDLHRPFPEKIVGKIAVSVWSSFDFTILQITKALHYLKNEYNVMHRGIFICIL